MTTDAFFLVKAGYDLSRRLLECPEQVNPDRITVVLEDLSKVKHANQVVVIAIERLQNTIRELAADAKFREKLGPFVWRVP